MNSHSTPKHDSVTNFLFSGIAGFIAHVIDYPFSMLVSRVVESKEKIRSVQQLKKTAFAESYDKSSYEKLRSLFPGFWVGETRRLCSRTFKYGFQPIAANQLAHLARLDEEKQPAKKVMVEATAGGATRLFQLLLFYPFDTIKAKRLNGNTEPVLQIVKKEKLNLYSAIELAVLNKVLDSMILFGVTATVLYALGVKNEKEASFWQIATASNIAATADTLVCKPISTVQARLQLETNVKVSAISLFKNIVRNEGISALYKGTVVDIITSFPGKALPLAISGWMISQWNKKAAIAAAESESSDYQKRFN